MTTSCKKCLDQLISLFTVELSQTHPEPRSGKSVRETDLVLIRYDGRFMFGVKTKEDEEEQEGRQGSEAMKKNMEREKA